MVTLYMVKGIAHLVSVDDSQQVTIDSPYLTLTAEQVVEKSKMQVGIHVMRNIVADTKIEENARTGIFKSIMLQLGVTSSGCYTYARNIRAHLSGGDAYTSNKKWNAKRAAELRAEKLAGDDVVIEAVEATQVVIEVAVEDHNRWCVEDKSTKSILNSFTTRTAAQEYNKKLKADGIDSRWFDNEKVSA